MIRLLFIGLLCYFFYRLLAGMLSGPRKDRSTPKETATEGKMVKCDACGLYVPEQDAVVRHALGKTTSFCSEACARKKKQS
ncbi:MAG: hypothetical protein JXO49_07870 [Deltaproteobacteria bacterium]|nr:hypothetical protein [Candidatus Anaeroferrophillus wilburensis]MBN2889245.1 hypothetical protein [Deltaproteobacteria bacterium]